MVKEKAPIAQDIAFDYVFIGMGAANSLILIKLFESGGLLHKNLAIIDPIKRLGSPKQSDKTFCFWATAAEMNEMGLAHLVSASWSKAQINNQTNEIHPFTYYQIKSWDLFAYSHEIIERLKIPVYADAIVETVSQQDALIVKGESGSVYRCLEAFDSRPPQFAQCQSNETHLLQSFYGYVVESEEAVFDSESFVMMDFQVPQMENTQFMYVLPYDSRHALVELTRFGSEPIPKLEAQNALQEYIQQHFGTVDILHDEEGIIPMSAAKITSRSQDNRLKATGGLAGRIKPSTGYAFKEMCYDAMTIAQNARMGFSLDLDRKRAHRGSRFAFYDRLLLRILSEKPQLGSDIFNALFSKIPMPKVLRFLEEKTNILQEIPILMSLPKAPFLKAAAEDLKFRFFKEVKNQKNVLFAVFVAMLVLLGFESAANIFVLLGLVLVGIPHGALDHLLESKGTKANYSFAFFAKYIGLMLGMYGLWLWQPAIGFTVFIGYSAWHFAESDFTEMKQKPNVFTLGWGLYVLATILFTHITELNLFLPYYEIPVLSHTDLFFGFPLASSILFVLGIGIYLLTILKPQYRMLRAVLAIIWIGSFLPLLLAFGIFFVGHHSWNTWQHLRVGFNAKTSTLFKKALPFSLGAFAFLGFFLLGAESGVTAYWAQFFVFLSCLSFPHVWEMFRFYKAQ